MNTNLTSAGVIVRSARYAIPADSPEKRRVDALKALWRANPRLSACAPLAGKLAAIDAAKAGADPIAANYVGQGYQLPEGYTWDRIAESRAKHPDAMMPVATAPGCVLWGVPIIDGEFLLHP